MRDSDSSAFSRYFLPWLSRDTFPSICQMDVLVIIHCNVAVLAQVAHGNRNRRLGYRKPTGYVNGPRIAFCFMQAQDHLQIIFR